MPKATLSLSPPLVRLQDEAAAIGVSFPALLTADLVRYQAMAAAAVPDLDDWEWRLLSHVLDGMEMHRVTSGDDTLPGPGAICAAIEEWCDAAPYEDVIRASELSRRAVAWAPLAIAGVFLQLRRAAATPAR